MSPIMSVVLCVRNGERTIERQLEALRAQDYPAPWELVLVDNASTDATPELLSRRAEKLPGCQLLVEPRLGLNFARNRGIGASRGAKIALCDADDEVSPEWLRQMVDALGSYDVVGGALDVERLNDPSVRHQSHNQIDELPSSHGRPYAVGANIAFEKRVWETIGGFDDRFSGGCDDTDFCLRAQDAGYTIGFAPAAIVHYRLRAELDRIARQHYDYGRGEERLLAKRNGLGLAPDGDLRARWRCLATETGRHLVESPTMLATPDNRRQFLERTAFLTGRLVELLQASSTKPKPPTPTA